MSEEKERICKEQKDAQRRRLKAIKDALEKAGFPRTNITCNIYNGPDWASKFPQARYLAARVSVLVDITKDEKSIVQKMYSICPCTELYRDCHHLFSKMRYRFFLLAADLKTKTVDGNSFDKKADLKECQLLTVAHLKTHVQREVDKRKAMSKEELDKKLGELLRAFGKS